MKDLVKRIRSFQEVLNNFKNKDVLVVIFEDYKLTVSTSHPASNAGFKSHHGNQTRTTDYWILLQRNEINDGEENSMNGNDSTLNETTDTQDTVGGPNMSEFDVEETQEVSNLKPISINEARFLVSLFSQCLKTSAFDMPLCIVCDGTDVERICLLEAIPIVKNDKVSSLNITSYSSSGPMHTKSDLITMDQILTKTSVANNHCSTAGFVQYDIMGKFYQDVSLAANHSHTSVKLDCVWEDVKNVLETPHGAKCTVHIKAVPGSLNSPAREIYSELCTLKNFAGGLTSGEIQFATSESSVSKSSVDTLLTALIESVKQGEQKVLPQKDDNASTPTDTPNVMKKFPVRKDLDFTERLWVLLKDRASSYNDILTSLRSVLDELHSGQLQPMVHRSNNTTLAKHIRASYQNKMTLNPKDVEGLEPLRMLVEIGIDKLKRDYLLFFISEGLETLDRLQWYLSPPDNHDLEVLAQRLEDLHRVSELYVVGSSSLKLPHDTLVILVRWGLRHYENPEHSGEDNTFSIQVDRSVMFRFYSNFQPTVWQVEVQCSSNEKGVSRTVYQLSLNQPFDHISYDVGNTTNVLDQTEADGDHFTMYETMASTSAVSLLL